MLANIKKFEFVKQSLVSLGHMIGGGEINIDPARIKVILKWPTPNNVKEFKSFSRESHI
jgi:hypothetical protein